jgi:branched-chain amino acid transport system ATP-binding protein
MLRIESLDVSIKSVRILRGVGLRVEQGQLVGLIGRNGAGKTTLMRAIMGVLPATAGSIEFDGAPMQGVPAYARARGGM